MRKEYKRKPRPEPPHWFFLDGDNCWWCKNRRGCNGCKVLKQVINKKKQGDRQSGSF